MTHPDRITDAGCTARTQLCREGHPDHHVEDCPVPEASIISLEAEVPEVLFEGMHEFLRSHPQWDQYRLISSALSSFLFQHGCADQGVSQLYLNGLFKRG